jgi:hypothetical protein
VTGRRTNTTGTGRGAFLAPIALMAAAALVAGCTGSSSTGAQPSARVSSGSSSTAGGGAGDSAARTYLNGQQAKPIGSASGTIATYSSTAPATADVLALTASPNTTTLRWQLSSPQAGTTMKGGFLGEDGAAGTGGVAILARQANLRLTPVKVDGACVCSEVPSKLGSQPVAMSGVYPPLPPGVTEVEVVVPGFPAIKVPVNRT